MYCSIQHAAVWFCYGVIMLRSFNHNQTSASTTWTINHNFGVPVIVDVNIGATGGPMTKVYPKTMSQTNGYNSVVLTFTAPQTGTSRIVADVPFTTDVNILTNPSWVPDDKSN